MHSPCKPPASTYTFWLGALSAVTVPVTITRMLCSTHLIDISSQAVNSGLSIVTVTLLTATFGLGWRRSVLRSRVERDTLTERIGHLEKRVEDTENAAWWGAPNDEDQDRTVDLAPNVFAIHHRQSQQRGAS